jgi:hypothetical protein
LIIFIWLIDHYLLFNSAKNFSDRLISFRDIESQISRKNRIIRIFVDGLYDDSARRRRIPPPPPVEILGAAAAEFSIPPPLNFSEPPPKQIRRRAEYSVSNTILRLCSAVVVSSVSMDNVNAHAAHRPT